MEILSVNIGLPRGIDPARPEKRTGIFKEPVEGRVAVGRLGLTGDAVMNPKYHGGPDQAVYLYGMGDYAHWADAEGIDVQPGLFGENLTVSGLESASLRVGDRLELGDVLLEVTAPRFPCATFAARMGNPGFVKLFRKAGRPGAYTRVLREGTVGRGDPVRIVPGDGRGLTLGEQFALHFEPRPARDLVARLLASPVAERERVRYEEILEGL